MGKKEEVKVRLSTVIYLFIIFTLVVALGIVYYFGFIDGNSENNLMSNVLDSRYTKITKELENEEIFLLIDTIKNHDGSYTLRGEIIMEDTSRQPIAEYPFYKRTEEYKEITLSPYTKCEYSVNSYDYMVDTVENVFSKRLYFAGGQGPCFNFVFENGECISVVEIVTGH